MLKSISHCVERTCDLCDYTVRYDQNQESITGWWIIKVNKPLQGPALGIEYEQHYDVCDRCIQTLPLRMRVTKG